MERNRLFKLGTLGVALGLAAAGCGSAAGGAVKPKRAKLDAVVVKGYGGVVADAQGHSTYVLEKNHKALLCTGSCTKIWPPLLVAKGTKIEKQPGLKGTVSLTPRAGKDQVVYNGWPLYIFSGDTGARQAHGQDIKNFGGTWHLASAAATSSAATPMLGKPSSSSAYGGSSGGSSNGGSSGGSGW